MDERNKFYETAKLLFEKGDEIKQEIKKRVKDERLIIGDLNNNLFYNPNTGQFFLLDVTIFFRRRGIGQEGCVDRLKLNPSNSW